MKSTNELIIIRGGGDIATGTIQVLNRAGFAVLVLETESPSAIRRLVALSEAVYDGEYTVEDVTCVCCRDYDQARQVMQSHKVALLVDPQGTSIRDLQPWAVVDAILAKRNLGTRRDMAPKTIALGPGFCAGVDVDRVIETMRGHNLGRIISEGSALPNTGVPGIIGGYGKERVVHSACAGYLYGLVKIGDTVQQGQAMAVISPVRRQTGVVAAIAGDVIVAAPLTGLVRGLIRDGYPVTAGFKIADVDPRESEWANCFTISDKARCIGGAVLTALLQLACQQGE